MTIIIDSDNYAAAGIEAFFFPGGEPHVRLPESLSHQDVLLFLKLRTWNDVGLAAALVDALFYSSARSIRSFTPYLPGARQDRSDGFTPITVDWMCQLLGIRHAYAWIFDPHSDRYKTAAPYKAAYAFMPSDLAVPVKPDVVGIIAPDAGARHRAKLFHSTFYPNADFLTCEKQRDFATGRFEGFNMPPLKRRGRYIIVDDICDGGGTFNLLAEAFKADPLGAVSSLELFVSHGIFSKGLSALDTKIEHITTTDSWCQMSSGCCLTVLPLNQLFPKILGASPEC